MRGLKYIVDCKLIIYNIVAPFAGAWIEILVFREVLLHSPVAPFAGAWIEIENLSVDTRRGQYVAPFAGAWIEIRLSLSNQGGILRRTLRGCVD